MSTFAIVALGVTAILILPFVLAVGAFYLIVRDAMRMGEK